ncbi:unnamed protein product [Miscanthus lutarioriparius]|uniref:Protein TRIGALACTOSYLDIACYLGLYCEROL 4, chloroplastic n=1 Tax=Miscanthus lutarioriparius TaxID=422564 RepID=A0A811MJ91_9POAL|nr:unnamed protein product [Miscanthus lutarioriparius]
MSLRRMRWMSDEDGRWELDAETPVTMEGTVRPVPGDPLPLGLSRGYRVTRPKQLDFFHGFMASPLVPTFSATRDGLSVNHAHILYITDNWSSTILEKINVNKLVSVVKEKLANRQEEASWTKDLKKHLHDVMSLGVGTEILITPDTTLLLELFDIKKGNRGKAMFHHEAKNLDALNLFGIQLVICGTPLYLLQLPHHNITLQASWPGLFVDKKGAYWDVPLSLSADLASVGSSSGLSYHLLLRQNSGEPKCFGGDETDDVPIALLPGLCAVASGYLGNYSRRVAIRDETQKSNTFRMFDERNKCAAFAGLFASVAFTAQYGNFQRLFLDLTRASARFDITSGSLFLCGASRLAQDFFFSRRPDVETFCNICPDVTVSLQQQIVGPLSFRVESSVAIDPRSQDHFVRVDDPIFAIDWAFKILGSAKATAWYSPKLQEAMVELRFYEA